MSTPMLGGVASWDNHVLASELSRWATVAAHHHSHAENAPSEFLADLWRASAERHEVGFLAQVDEARARLAAGDADLRRHLHLLGVADLLT